MDEEGEHSRRGNNRNSGREVGSEHVVWERTAGILARLKRFM